jgi:NAD(P)-dependent dehydrogenase (short-subunit alcohol dehydrogenase family)
MSKDRPYPGSTTIASVNGGVTGMIRSWAVELAPVRFNAIHPGLVPDTPVWSGKPDAALAPFVNRTPTGQLASTRDVAHAALFLFDNPSVNGVNLAVDGGYLMV